MLFRFRESQAADLGIIDAGRTRRPKNISSIDAIPACEKWRGQVLKEISRKVSRIQDPSLSDYQIRDLNDEINKLMREKHVWEIQIRNLGGPNYTRSAGGGRLYDESGREIPGGGKGYKYYGRARELPGVRELFEAAAQKQTERTANQRDRDANGRSLAVRDDLRKNVDAAYYGYDPEEDSKDTLLQYEARRERDALEAMLETAGLAATDPPPDWEPLPGDAGDGQSWVLPTLEEVQEELIDRRKRRLLEKFSRE